MADASVAGVLFCNVYNHVATIHVDVVGHKREPGGPQTVDIDILRNGTLVVHRRHRNKPGEAQSDTYFSDEERETARVAAEKWRADNPDEFRRWIEKAYGQPKRRGDKCGQAI
jgi:hypothetical protein